MRARAVGGIVLASAALAACQLLPSRAAAPFPLLPPASLGATIERQQVLHLAAGETVLTLQCVVRVTPEQLVVVALGPLGQRAFTLTYDAAGVRAERAPGAPEGPEPQRLLADLQMALWPQRVLDAATAGTAWQVLESPRGVRRVLRAGRSYAEIRHEAASPWDGRLWLVNFADDYSLAIDSRPLGG